VSTPNGVRFTRRGNFSINKEGELVTTQGFKLLSAQKGDANQATPLSERTIKLPANSKISVSREGDIFSKQGPIGKMSIVEFKDMHALRKEGHSLFINNANDNIQREKVTTAVNQGFVEGSNVNAIKEMSELITAHRHFENIQKAINAYDQLAGRIVNDIADF
jgi:flagellar basal-body rod protein FlgF